MRLRCYTYFDITPTGIKSHYKTSQIPLKTSAGLIIDNALTWHHARNQQRNWETINQIIGLRTLPLNISTPVQVVENDKKIWEFEFDVEQVSEIHLGNDPLGALYYDCNGVPMLTGLDENQQLEPMLVPRINIVFEPAQNK